MELAIDLSTEYGLALEGGGAKGAYQIGVLNAFQEAGMRICAIAGVSVGALNGALFCQGSLAKAENLWKSLTRDCIFPAMENRQNAAAFFRMLQNGGLAINPLRQLITENVDIPKLKASPIPLYVAAFSRERRREVAYDVRKLPDAEICDMLLASAYLPLFRKEKLAGGTFLDGGILDKVPVDLLKRQGVKHIIAIRIFGIGLNRVPLMRLEADETYMEVKPEENLGGMLSFSPERAVYHMQLGYYDGLRFLYGLSGKKYYFDCDKYEKMCYNIESMEKLGAKLGLPRFQVYHPHAFIERIRENS